jgi:hypothetical protein
MKYVTIDIATPPAFEILLENHITNMQHYFDVFFNTYHKVMNQMLIANDKSTPLTIPLVNGKDHTTHSDEQNKNSKIYNKFVQGMFEQAHKRLGLQYENNLPEQFKKAEIHLFNDVNSTIVIVYKSKVVIMQISFNNQDFLTIRYGSKNQNKKMRIMLNINKENEILSTEIQNDGDDNTTTGFISFNHTQLDYLITLLYYSANDEDIDNIEYYINNITNNKNEELLDYFKVKDMVYI